MKSARNKNNMPPVSVRRSNNSRNRVNLLNSVDDNIMSLQRESGLEDKPLSQLIKYTNQRIPWFKLKGSKYQEGIQEC